MLGRPTGSRQLLLARVISQTLLLKAPQTQSALAKQRGIAPDRQRGSPLREGVIFFASAEHTSAPRDDQVDATRRISRIAKCRARSDSKHLRLQGG